MLAGAGAPAPPDTGLLKFTEFSRTCAKLWLRLYGRRFGVNRAPRADAGTRRATAAAGTDASIVEQRRRATSSIMQRVADGGAGIDDTIVGVHRSRFVRRPADRLRGSPSWNANFARFHQATESKVAARRKHEAARTEGGNPYPTAPLRRAGLTAIETPRVRPEGRIRLLVWPPTSPALTAPASLYEITDSVKVAGVQKADVIVSESPALLDTPADAGTLKVALVVVGLGKDVIFRKDWRGNGPFTDMSSVVIHHVPAVREPERIHLSSALASKHPNILEAFRVCADSPGSSWRLTSEDPTVSLASTADVAAFVRRVRRVAVGRLGGGSYAARRGRHACAEDG